MAESKPLNALGKKLRGIALAYPETREDFPWGHSAFKVREKAFLFMGQSDDGLGLSVKLPHSRDVALAMPFTEPTGYGLGKSGWVSAKIGPKEKVPLALLEDWIEESFRAIAPKKVAALLPDRDRPTPVRGTKKPATRKKTGKKKTTKKAAVRRKR